MDHTATFEAYLMFRQTEAEHVAKTYEVDETMGRSEEGGGDFHTNSTQWVFTSKNTEYENFLLNAYDASLKTNSMGDS